MGVFDKLMFWKKKEDDLGLNNLGGMPGAMPGMNQMGDDPFSTDLNTPRQPMGQYQQYQQPPQYPQQPQYPQPSFSRMDYAQPSLGGQNREMEVVSAKLDALKAYMDSINQRLANLERLAEQQQSGRRW